MVARGALPFPLAAGVRFVGPRRAGARPWVGRAPLLQHALMILRGSPDDHHLRTSAGSLSRAAVQLVQSAGQMLSRYRRAPPLVWIVWLW